MKVWTVIDRLSTVGKSDDSAEIKRAFFQAVVMWVIMYRCTIWTLPKHIKKKLCGNWARMLRFNLNKSWEQHPTKQQLCSHLPPISQTIQVRHTRHSGEIRTNSLATFSDRFLHMNAPVLAEQQELCGQVDAVKGTSHVWWSTGTESGTSGYHHDLMMIMMKIIWIQFLPKNWICEANCSWWGLVKYIYTYLKKT